MTDFLKSEQYIKQHRAETIDTICRFATTDLLLFWDKKEDIYERQQKIWRPLLDNTEKQLSTDIKISYSLRVPDNKVYLAALKNRINELSDKKLTTAFLTATQLKSVILGLAILDKQMNVEEIFNAAFLEELYQNELWGTDEEALQKREQIKVELQKIKEYLLND